VSFTDTSSGSPTTWSWTFGDGATSTAQHPTHSYATAGTFTVRLTAGNASGSASASEVLTVNAGTPGLAYPIVDTGQSRYFDTESEINAPSDWEPFYGQDAQYVGTQPSYTTSSDGLTVKDNVTGLTWQKSFDSTAVYWTDAQAKPAALNKAKHGGYSDWRLPTIKELYSLWNGNTGWPYIDTNYFAVSYASQDELSHAIFWSSNKYSGRLESTLDVNVGAEMAFGVNFGTGHIKAYSAAVGPKHLVRCVRGASYGINSFVKNGDGTITDQATGLMWAEADSGVGMDWEHALDYAQTQNFANFLGFGDWRLPNSKELQSLVDYTRAPGATAQANVGPAIDPLFRCTGITNESGTADYPWYWTSTSAIAQANGAYESAWYVAFGRAVDFSGKDLHGAGAVRFDLKTLGGPARQDAERVYNYVRLVRDAKE
jgi:PKD repeat protein